ncbi:MAG: DUF928 domain-containing protein [Coleofasciculus sp. S288]|nr:DUF928 domain-containing protein [Coleofasciculus sp. S288]
MKLPLQQIVLSYAIALTFVCSTSYPKQVEAQSVRLVSNSPSSGRLRSIPLEWSNQESPDFSSDGRPSQREGGASRGECQVKGKPPLLALVPDTNVALTVAESPTFWFYVPYTLTPEHSVELVLKDDQDNYRYKTKFPGRGTPPGVVNLRLPSTVSLDTDKNYSWHFLVYCDSQKPSRYVYVNGWIRRVERPNLKSQIEPATPQERYILYASEGLWYDAITTLAKTRQAYPQDDQLKEDWVTLLQSIGWGNLASEPIVPCCSSTN